MGSCQPEGLDRSRGARRAPLALLLALALAAPGAAPAAEGWSGTLGLFFMAQDLDGSEGSFQTQYNLDEGVTLDELSLDYRGGEDKFTEFKLRAHGFGDAEPAQSLRLDWRFARHWLFEVDRDHRESIFSLQEHDRSLRSDDWDVERLRAGVTWDGWKAARLSLDFRQVDRSGRINRPIYGLAELYPLALDLDESMQETTFALQTRNLPVTLRFEHSLATYERQNRRQPAGSLNLEADDVDVFAGADESRKEERDVPTSRLVASYGSDRVEVVGSLLYSPAELDGLGPVSSGFGVNGGAFGRIDFVDDFVTAADMDNFTGNLRFGVALNESWTLRFEGDYRDSSTDATLLGQQILRVTNPFGTVFEIAGEVDDASFFDVTEDFQRLTVEWGGERFTVWGGGFVAGRDVSWQRGRDAASVDVTRDSDGFLAGVSWSNKGVSGSLEYETGSFDRFVIRTDPETVDRLKLRLKAQLKKGWQARLSGRLEEADNPTSVAGLDRSTEAFGAGLAWSSEDGAAGFGVDVDLLDLASATDLILPQGQPDVSIYDLSLLTAGLNGRYQAGKVRLTGSATRVDDSGATWPLEAWIGRAQIGVEVSSGVEIAVRGEYWSYDEGRAERDDFDVTRYGIGIRWSFQ